MSIARRAEKQDLHGLADWAGRLWPGHTTEELEEEFRECIGSNDAAFFLLSEEGRDIGFAQCQLRRDYVEGTQSSPVGYLEGIYVREEYRRRGCARILLRECERWASGKGCTEFASDCALGNGDSLRFHLSAGFREANRIICFAKKL